MQGEVVSEAKIDFPFSDVRSKLCVFSFSSQAVLWGLFTPRCTATGLGAIINSRVIAAIQLRCVDKAAGSSAQLCPWLWGHVPWAVAPRIPLASAGFIGLEQHSEITP